MRYSILLQIVDWRGTFLSKGLTCVDIAAEVAGTHGSTQATSHPSHDIVGINFFFLFEAQRNCWRLHLFFLCTCSISMWDGVWYWCSFMFSLLIIFLTFFLGAYLDVIVGVIVEIDGAGFAIFVFGHLDCFFGILCRQIDDFTKCRLLQFLFHISFL